MEFKCAMSPIGKFESEIANKLLTNSESWLGLNQTHLDKLKEFQNIFLRRVFQVSQLVIPKGILNLDGQNATNEMEDSREEAASTGEDEGKRRQ